MPAFLDDLPSVLREAFALLLPVECAGCGAPDVSLCEVCRAALRPRVEGSRVEGRRVEGAGALRREVPGGLVVTSALTFDGVPARVIRALKEDGRTALARPLGAVLAEVLPVGAVLVPVPASREALRRRGFAVVELLLRRAGASPARLLRPARGIADQRGLGQREREANVAGAFRTVPRARCAPGPVWLVDDVVTTGATLVEAARALRAAGVEVGAAVALADTPHRNPASSPASRRRSDGHPH